MCASGASGTGLMRGAPGQYSCGALATLLFIRRPLHLISGPARRPGAVSQPSLELRSTRQDCSSPPENVTQVTVSIEVATHGENFLFSYNIRRLGLMSSGH